MLEDRIEKAVALFKSGYNCSQSVVAAFADLYGIDEVTALRMSASFGGGIGRMRQTCGAACGMGSVDAGGREAKAYNYAVVQQLAAEFKQENGSLICGELLGLAPKAATPPTPEARTAEYYKKRPCSKMVETAATIFARFLESKIEK